MDAITRHHYENIANGKAVENEDGSLSTVKTIIVEIDGREVLIPTVWDGQIVSQEEAIRRSMESGIEWPSDEPTEEGRARLQATDDQAHMEFDRNTTPEEATEMLSPTSEDMGFALGGLGTIQKGITTPEGLEMANKKFQLDEADADTDGDGELTTREKEIAKAIQRDEILDDDAVKMSHGGMACGCGAMDGGECGCGGSMMDGIMGYDDVSGNPIPLGSHAENVRDDIDAKLSTDEYVLPAHVVKYHGLKHIQMMQTEAEMGLMSMKMEGLIQQAEGSSTSETSEEEEYEDHMMYDPETGEGKMTTSYQDHLDLKEKGWGHDEINATSVDVEIATVEVDDHLEDDEDKTTTPKSSKLPSVRQNKTVAYMV